MIYDGRGEFDRGAEVKKKAYFAYKEMVEMLSNTTLVYTQDDETTFLSIFMRNNSEKISVLWQDKWMGNKTVRILGNGSMIVYSIYGEEISTTEDSIDLNLDIEPVYIIGDVEKYRYISAPPVEHP